MTIDTFASYKKKLLNSKYLLQTLVLTLKYADIPIARIKKYMKTIMIVINNNICNQWIITNKPSILP